MRFLIITLLLLSYLAHAQEPSGGNQFTLDSEMIRTEEELKRIEASPNNEFEGNITILERNVETGVYDSSYDTTNDSNRLSFSGSLKAGYEDAVNINTFDLQYGHKFSIFWLEMMVDYTKGVMNSMNDEIKVAGQTNPWSESNINRSTINSQSFLTGGVGLGLRFRLFQSLFETKELFETTAAYLTYSQMTDFHTKKAYSGPGLRVDFNFQHRLSASFYWALKFGYHVNSLTRAAVNKETANERTLTFSWMSMGLELGSYF